MSGLDALFFGSGSLPQIVVGAVYQAPADTTHGVMVVIQGAPYGPLPWGPPRGATLPAPGDPVLVVFPTNGDPWVVGWWPYGGV